MIFGALFTFDPVAASQDVGAVSMLTFKDLLLPLLAPILGPIIGALIFVLTLEIIIERLRQVPLEPGGSFMGRLTKKNTLIALLFSTLSAFSVWLSFQPQEFKVGFMLPIELITGTITSNTPLYILATTLASIAVIALLL